MKPPERYVRILAILLIVAGLGAAGLAILADQVGVGSAPGMFGWKRITLLVAGVGVTALGVVLLARPGFGVSLIDWERMGAVERMVRITATFLVIAGLAASGLAILAEELGVGSAPGMFGWKRVSLLVGGAVVTALGAVLLARPRIISKRPIAERAAEVSARPAFRRWLTLAALVSLVALIVALSIPRLADQLIGSDGGNDAPAPEAGPPLPAEPGPGDTFHAMATATCEGHQARLHEIVVRGYTSGPSARPLLLRSSASAISALRTDLRRLTPPAEWAASYSQLLESLRRMAAAHRQAAAAIEQGQEAAEERHVADIFVAASEASDAAAGIGLYACQ